MPFAAVWVDLEIIILSEVRGREISYEQNLERNDTNEVIYKTGTDS